MALAQTHLTPTPLNIEFTRAKLLMQSHPARVSIETEKSGLNIENSPVRLEINNRAFFDSMGLKSNERLSLDFAEESRQAGYEATAQIAQEGDALVGPHAMTIADIIRSRTNNTIETVLAFIPSEKPELNWSDPRLDITYTPDKLHISWDTGGVETEYVPYSLNIQKE